MVLGLLAQTIRYIDAWKVSPIASQNQETLLKSITKFLATVITQIVAKVLFPKSVRRILSLTSGKPNACLLLNHRDIKGEEVRVIRSTVVNHRLQDIQSQVYFPSPTSSAVWCYVIHLVYPQQEKDPTASLWGHDHLDMYHIVVFTTAYWQGTWQGCQVLNTTLFQRGAQHRQTCFFF